MKAINASAKKIMDKLTEGLNHENTYRKIGTDGASFMPVIVELVGKNLVSVAHYYEQNGDLMSDLEMVFLHGCDENWYPISITMSGIGRTVQSATLNNDGTVNSFYPREQADEAVFAGKWMQNIKHQQKAYFA